MTSEHKQRVNLLRVLARSEPKVVKTILQTADLDLVNLLSECALNLLNKNVKVSQKRKKTLKKFRKEMETLAYDKLPLKKKRTILQKGGFLSVLLPAIIPSLLKALKIL